MLFYIHQQGATLYLENEQILGQQESHSTVGLYALAPSKVASNPCWLVCSKLAH
jgi:hypothetical protein